MAEPKNCADDDSEEAEEHKDEVADEDEATELVKRAEATVALMLALIES
jgi:membrane protein required for beta-lactamase induction